MKWSRIILIIQGLLIGLLVFMLMQKEAKSKSEIEMPYEICRKAKIEFVTWESSIHVQHTDLKSGKDQIESDKERVIRNFTAKGITPQEIEVAPVEIEQIEQEETSIFKLSQKIVVKSKDVARVNRIRQESSELLRFKVQLSVSELQYEIENFETWLLSTIPGFLQEARLALNTTRAFGNKKLDATSVRLNPLYSNDFEICDRDANGNLTSGITQDSVSVRLKGRVSFAFSSSFL